MCGTRESQRDTQLWAYNKILVPTLLYIEHTTTATVVLALDYRLLDVQRRRRERDREQTSLHSRLQPNTQQQTPATRPPPVRKWVSNVNVLVVLSIHPLKRTRETARTLNLVSSHRNESRRWLGVGPHVGPYYPFVGL